MIQSNLKQLLSFVCESKYPFSAIFFCLALHILDVICLSIDWFPTKFSISNLYQRLKRFNQVTVIEFGFFHRPPKHNYHKLHAIDEFWKLIL